MRSIRFSVLLSICVLLLVVAGPGAAFAQPAPIPTQPAPSSPHAAQPTAQPLSSPASQLETVRQAFDLLMEHFFRPLDSVALLSAAWKGAYAAADGQQAASAQLPALSLTGAQQQDWASFAANLDALTKGQPVEPDVVAQGAVRAMAEALNEGHTVFMDPQRYEEHQAWSRGDVHYGGIGARITGSEPVVVEVFEGSPAEAAGLQPGDLIVEIDGHPISGTALTSTINQVRGPAGTEVILTVRRPGIDEPLELHIPRAEVQIRMVSSRMLTDKVGYVLLRGFPEPSVLDKVREAITGLESEDAQSLILDLRGNSGGRLDVGRRMLSMFISSGPLYQQVSRDGSSLTASAHPSRDKVDLPLAVLVDGSTASMGEIFAAAVKEHAVATVLGETTSGNVAAGQVFPLADGSALQVTIMEIRTGLGKPMNGIGVAPDVEVANTQEDLRLGHDAQLAAALEQLTRPASTAVSFPRFSSRVIAA